MKYSTKFPRIAFIFPGQGAQYPGMGKDFYDNFTRAREIFQHGDEILQRKVSAVAFNGPQEMLMETKNSQTAIYLNSIAILNVIQQQFPDLKPAVCAGLSLGEYTALTSSGRIPFETCLPLVQFRAMAMNAACEATKGTMAAVFGLSAEEVENLVRQANLPNDLWVANFNCPGQTVISGSLKGVESGIEAAKAKGAKRVIPLKVHGAFHSGLMRLAEEQLAEKIGEIAIHESSIAIVMNVVGNYVQDKEEIRHNLIRQVTSPVRWEQGIHAMEPIDLFIEIGPGKTLAGMNKQIQVAAPTLSIGAVQDLDKLSQILGE